MARPLMFRYASGSSALHRLDLRLKVIVLAAFSAAALSLPLIFHAGLALLVVLFWYLGKLTVKDVFRSIVPFLGFLILIAVPPFVASTDAAQEGLRIAENTSRFLLLILSAHAMMRTTSPAQIGEAIEFYLGWLGKRIAHNAAVMSALVISFLPQILERAWTLRSAAQLRGWKVKKSPLTLVRIWSFPLLRTLMERSAWTAHSMELRAFSPQKSHRK